VTERFGDRYAALLPSDLDAERADDPPLSDS
jgi:hypothetical protein